MNMRTCIAFLALALATANLSCTRSQVADETSAVASETGGQAGHDEHTGHEVHGEHGADAEQAAEPSDLDSPVAELVSRTCEHGIRTFECDACRYEVGFVRAPSALIEEGLLTTTRAERQKIAAPIALTGEIQFDERRVAHVSTQVDGIIKQVHVALGEKVKRGQALLEIESVAVGEDHAASLEARGMLTLARRNFERVSELRQEGIASEKELFQAKQELEAAEIRAAAVLEKLNRLGTGDAAGGLIVLRAPLDGIVLVMHAVSGEIAKSDQALLTVGDNAEVWVWADLYEKDIAAVMKGQGTQKLAATIAVKAYPGEKFPGTVDLISPAMDEFSRTVKVRIQVKNTDRRLLAGMFATVELHLPGTEETLAVPRLSMLEDEGRSFVFVHYQGDYWVRRPVVAGRTWAGWVEVQEGLGPSEIVVAEGAFLLKSDVLRSKMGAGCAD